MTISSLCQHWNQRSIVAYKSFDGFQHSSQLKFGMVVGTFAAVPYIHLQLEARARFFPQVPFLVHDDGSHKSRELCELCEKYGVDFESNVQRQPPCVGDLTAFVGGLWWAQQREIDLLVKISRRWLFLVDWTVSMSALAMKSQYATFCSYTTTFSFGFRTECVGLSVRTWSQPAFLCDALEKIQAGQSVFVEGYVHDFAREFERGNCGPAEDWRQAHPMPEDRNGYALWTLMGTDRCERSPYFLWHDSAGPGDYFRLAQDWNLPYQLSDFVDPNEGAGNGIAAA